jgi:hypothetical protein
MTVGWAMTKPKNDSRYKGVKQDYWGHPIEEEPEIAKVERQSVRSKVRDKIANVWTKGDAIGFLADLSLRLSSAGSKVRAVKVDTLSASIQEQFKDLEIDDEIESSEFDKILNDFSLPFLYDLELAPIRKTKAVRKRNKKDYADKKTGAYADRQIYNMLFKLLTANSRIDQFRIRFLEDGGAEAEIFNFEYGKKSKKEPDSARAGAVERWFDRLTKNNNGLALKFRVSNVAGIQKLYITVRRQISLKMQVNIPSK